MPTPASQSCRGHRRRYSRGLPPTPREHRLQGDGDEGHVHEQEGQGRAEGPVIGPLELALDDVGDHLAVRSAQQVWRQVGAQGGNEGDDHAGRDARQGQGRDNGQQGANMPGAQVEAGLDERGVQPVQGRVERQDHEGQVDVDQPQHDGEVVVQELQGLEGPQTPYAKHAHHRVQSVPEPLQRLVHIPLGPEDGDQCVGPDQKVGPEGQHDGQEQPGLGLRRGEGDGEGDREADHQTDQGRQPGDADRLDEDLQVERVEGPEIVRESPRQGDLGQAPVLAEGIEPDDPHGDHEEEDQPEQRRAQDSAEQALRRLPVLFHQGTPASGQAARTRVTTSS
jgi:hypothetical protein